MLSVDPRVLSGRGVRPGDWQIGGTLQQQVLPRVSVEVGYVRRWLTNFYVTDNLAVGAVRLHAVRRRRAVDPRLPGGGGYNIAGLYDVNPALFGVTNNLLNLASDYGTVSSVYNGVELSVNARIRGGLQLQGGSSIGSQVIDSCEARAKLPEQNATNSPITGGVAYNPLNPYCHNAPGFTNRMTALATYTIPKVDVQVSGTLASSPGIPLAANYTYSTAQADDVRRPPAVGERAPHGQSGEARRRLGRSAQRGRLPRREEPPARQEPGPGRARLVQPDEQQLGDHEQPDVQPDRHHRVGGLAVADRGDDGADRQDHRAVRLLEGLRQ